MEALNRRQLLDHDVDVGNLYRALRRMEHDGLVTSLWNTHDPGPNKRVYEITPAGEQLLQHWAETLESRLRHLNHFLEEYHRRIGPPAETPQRPPEDTRKL
jgi:poly-beta-hydroxybutyrate-responsive repressor